MKDIEKTVERYKIRKDQADEFRKDARRFAERKSALDENMQQLELDKVELETKVKDGHEKYRAAEKLKSDIQGKKTRLDELERNKRDLESDITRIISASVEELEREIEKFQLTKVNFSKIIFNLIYFNFKLYFKDQRLVELNGILEELKRLDRQCAGNSAAQQEKLVQLGKLQSEEEQYKKRIKERDYLLCDLAQRFQWAGYSRNLNEVLSN